MKNSKKAGIDGQSGQSVDPAAASARIPLSTRLSIEIPQPKDWQAFQRNCVLLFSAELNDPNAQEYGRRGQNQGGIDVLGKRNGNPNHYVGVQCRHVRKPLKEAGILTECRAALEIKAGLKEIIFATTAPDDTNATNAAIAVEQTLRAEGHDLTVVVYGWEALQILISRHEVAYAAFFPSIVATSAPVALGTTLSPDADFAVQVAAQVVEQLRQTGLAPPPRDIGAAGSTDEDPALHARIDTYRDLFKDQHEPLLAENGLLKLLENEVLDGKPWALFRIETNLGSIALDLGREADGAARYETAFSIRPDDSNAIANLALARTIQGRYEEAMELARQALEATPRADHAVAYFLQAAARSTWQGEPETLIPPELVGSEHADLGLAEFLRRRNVPGWAKQSLELSRRHPDRDVFKRIRALSVLSLALDAGGMIPGGHGPVSFEELNAAADDLKAITEHCLDVGFADQHDLAAYLNNTGVLLRLAGRHVECETLLRRGLAKAPSEPQLRRLLALVQATLGRPNEAIATLGNDHDSENRLIRAELVAIDDPAAALVCVLEIDPAALDSRLARRRWELVGELALKTGDMETVRSSIAALRDRYSADVNAALLELRGEQKAGLDEDAVRGRLRAIAVALPADADMATRYFLAEQLRRQRLPEEASMLLEHHVDLSRMSPLTTLYLQSLAEARRDEAFHNAIAAASPLVREDPEILWTMAAHAWNVGDLADAYRAIEVLLAHTPDNPRARLLKVEILVRQDRSEEVFAELERGIEELGWTHLPDQFRVASLLGHFGYLERAVALAYRLFLEHRDQSQAWMTLSALVLKEGRAGEDAAHLWDAPLVADNVAVDFRYDDGEKVFLVVEPEATLRALDGESLEPDHPLVRTLMGLAKGERFIGPDGRQGAINELRHKYVARLHHIIQRYESRFPEIFGIRMVSGDVEQTGGLDEVIADLKMRREWIDREQEQYQKGPWPLEVLAYRVGLDTIEVADGLAMQGVPLKVAIGNEPEREAAACAIRDNAHKGCVLDLLAFWTGWRLQALDVIASICGPIHLPQSLIDRLRARRQMIDLSMKDGLRSVSYEAGKLALTEVAPEKVKEWRDDVDAAIAWAEGNATIRPSMAREALPPALREHLRAGPSGIFDSLVIAEQARILLVTDDLPTREIGRSVVSVESAWTHKVFELALDEKRIDIDTFIRWTAHVISYGHNYIGVTGQALARALLLDAETGQAPGYLFNSLSKVIGGRNADPASHIRACLNCLRDLWLDDGALEYRSRATGLLLEQLIRERYDDHVLMLRAVLHSVRDRPQLLRYILSWMQGHFIVP